MLWVTTATGTSRPSFNDLMRHRQPFSFVCCCSVIHVTPCIHVTLHVAPHLLICLRKKNKTPSHTTNFSDLLSVEVVQRQPQHVQSSLGRIVSVLGNFDEHVLENLYERQVIKSALMNNALTLNHQNIILKRAKRPSKVEDYGESHPPAATADRVNVKKSAQETEQQQHTLRKELKRKAKIVDLEHQKKVLERRNMNNRK